MMDKNFVRLKNEFAVAYKFYTVSDFYFYFKICFDNLSITLGLVIWSFYNRCAILNAGDIIVRLFMGNSFIVSPNFKECG
jgi:hypothetical protein